MKRISHTKVMLLIVTAICAGLVWAEVKKAETQTKPATTQKVDAKPGLRGPVGPDVPLTKAEEKAFAKRITVKGFTAKAIQAACDRAKKEGISVIYLPPGRYEFANRKTVYPHEGQTILGTGAKTHLKNKVGFMFRIQCNNVRLTRLKMEGADTTFSRNNLSCAFRTKANYGKNLRVDHCEMLGFEWAASFWQGSVGQVDHCVIHDNAREGMGYGVLVYGARAVLICDNVFWSCRHVVCGEGANGHYTFRHNHVKHDKGLKPGGNHSCIDAHSGMKGGSFVVEYNIFENVKQAQGTWAASGLIRGNIYRNIRRTAICHTSKEGAIIENNKFENVATKYKVNSAQNVTIDGKVVKGPQKPLTFPRLKEMKQVGQKELQRRNKNRGR